MAKKIITQAQKDYIKAHWDDMSLEEIALEINLSIGTVYRLGKMMGLGPKPQVCRCKPGPKPKLQEERTKPRVHRVRRKTVLSVPEFNAKARAAGLSYRKYGAMLRAQRS